jgi:hypothetical protein
MSQRLQTRGDAVMVRALTYLVVLGVLAGFIWAYWEGQYRQLPFPHNSFLYLPSARFTDLTGFHALLHGYHPYSVTVAYTYAGTIYHAGAIYPPFAYVIAQPFAWLGGNAAVVLWVLLVAIGLGAFIAWELDFVPPVDRAAAVVILTFVTYPFLFAFDRGNIEVFLTLLLAASVWALQTDRPELAAVAIGAAAAMKGYPLIFAALFVVRGRWRPLAITAVTTAGLTLAAALAYHFDLSQYRQNLHSYNHFYVTGDLGLGWGCSLWGVVKLLAVDALGGGSRAVHDLLPVYTALSAVLAVGVVLALWRLRLRFWEQIALLTLAIELLPTVSADYKLLHLVVPLVLFLRYGARDRWRWWYLVGFAALMVPKAYVLLRPSQGVNLGVLLNPLIMLAMGLAIVASGFSRRYGNEGANVQTR